MLNLSLGGFFRVLLLLLMCIICLLCALPLFESASCKDMEDCDLFQPICASYKNEHQFFYSQCDMVREACLTGKAWKYDYFSHCNVFKQ